MRRSLILLALTGVLMMPAALVRAQDTARRQSELASKTVKLKTVEKTAEEYKKALEAKDVAGALKLVDKPAAFKGTVVKVFTPESGSLVVLNFATDYKSALTAVVRKKDFGAFPDLNTLVDKEVLVSGKISLYQERPQIALTSPDQLKLVK